MVLDWVKAHPTLIWWLIAFSVVVFVASVILVPILLVRIPSDYFTRKSRPVQWADLHPAARAALIAARTLIGFALVLAGIAMLVLPGQGVLAILAGLMLMEFPGKERFERWIVSRGPVLRSINWLRKRRGHQPLAVE